MSVPKNLTHFNYNVSIKTRESQNFMVVKLIAI